MNGAAAERGRGWGLARLALLYAALIALLAVAQPSPPALLAGGALVVAGEAVRLWAAGHLTKTVELVTSGPYRHTRNPLYLGRLLILTGLCIAASLPYRANLALLAAAWAGFFGYYLPRKERVEPERLARAHGEAYARYRREVPALWPRATPWRGGDARRWSRARMLRNREHWMVAALAAALAWLALRAGTG